MRKTKPLKTVFFHHGSSLGGASRSLIEILRNIDRDLFEVSVVLPSRGDLTEILDVYNIPYSVKPLFIFYHCAFVKSPLTFLSCLRFFALFLHNSLMIPVVILRNKADTVVVNSSTLLLCGAIGRLMRKRLLWHVREVHEPATDFINRVIGWIIGRCAHEVIVNSEHSMENVRQLGIPEARVIPPSVDVHEFNHENSCAGEKRRGLGIAQDAPVIGYASQIYEEKGWKVFLKAAFILLNDMPNVKFLVCGGDVLQSSPGKRNGLLGKKISNAENFQEAAREFGIEKNFVFLGVQREMKNIYPLMDILVFPSIAPESFGRVMIEAMACGVPVAASRLGTASEIISEGVSGVLFQPGNAKDLAGKLMELIKDPELRKRMGAVSRERAVRLFDSKQLIRPIMKTYAGET